MKKYILSIFLCFSLVFILSACGNKYTYIQNPDLPTSEDQIIEFVPYKESVYKQLEDEIVDIDKMEEADFNITDYENKEWEMSLLLDKKVFHLHMDRLINIKAQKNNILYNNYEEVMTKLKAEEQIANDLYSTVLGRNDFTYMTDVESSSTYYSFTINNIANPTLEDYNNKNNNFYLYIHLDGEKTRNESVCSETYFKKIEKSIEELLKTKNFKDISNITISVYVAGCGELKYSLIGNTPIIKILRTNDGEDKNNKILNAGKTDFEKMTPEERKKFLEENNDLVQESIKYSQEQALYEEAIIYSN